MKVTHSIWGRAIVDNTTATALPTPFLCPSHFSDTTRSSHHGTGCRILCNKNRKRLSLVIVQNPFNLACINKCFNDCVHNTIIRQCRT